MRLARHTICTYVRSLTVRMLALKHSCCTTLDTYQINEYALHNKLLAEAANDASSNDSLLLRWAWQRVYMAQIVTTCSKVLLVHHHALRSYGGCVCSVQRLRVYAVA